MRKKISKAQIKKIHTVISKKGMKDSEYRDILSGLFKVKSSLKLTAAQAGKLIEVLEPTKWRALSYRQMAMINGLWKDVSFVKNKIGRQAALMRFLERRYKVSDLRFLDVSDAHKVIAALRAMKRQKKEVS